MASNHAQVLEPAGDRLVVKLNPLPTHWLTATLTTFVNSLSRPGPASVRLPRPTSVHMLRSNDGLQPPSGLLLYDWPNEDENIFAELVCALGRFADEQPKLPATFVPVEPIKASLIYQTAPIVVPARTELPSITFPFHFRFEALSPPAQPAQPVLKRPERSAHDRLQEAQAKLERLQKQEAFSKATQIVYDKRVNRPDRPPRKNLIKLLNDEKLLRSQAQQPDHSSSDSDQSSSTVKSS